MNKELSLYLVLDDLQDMSGSTRMVVSKIKEREFKIFYKLIKALRKFKNLHIFETFNLYVYLSDAEEADVLEYGYKLAYMGYDEEEFQPTRID